ASGAFGVVQKSQFAASNRCLISTPTGRRLTKQSAERSSRCSSGASFVGGSSRFGAGRINRCVGRSAERKRRGGICSGGGSCCGRSERKKRTDTHRGFTYEQIARNLTVSQPRSC